MAENTLGSTAKNLSFRDIVSIIGKSLREFKTVSLVTPLLVLGEVVVEVSIPFVTAQLINIISTGADLSVIAHYAGILIGMALVSLTFGGAAGYTGSVA